MNDVKYTVKTTGQFRKDYKPAIRRGRKTELLDQVITMLAKGETLPLENTGITP